MYSRATELRQPTGWAENRAPQAVLIATCVLLSDLTRHDNKPCPLSMSKVWALLGAFHTMRYVDD